MLKAVWIAYGDNGIKVKVQDFLNVIDATFEGILSMVLRQAVAKETNSMRAIKLVARRSYVEHATP